VALLETVGSRRPAARLFFFLLGDYYISRATGLAAPMSHTPSPQEQRPYEQSATPAESRLGICSPPPIYFGVFGASSMRIN
jgi:hypothetical protein